MAISNEEQDDSQQGSEERHLPNPTRRRSDTPCHQRMSFCTQTTLLEAVGFQILRRIIGVCKKRGCDTQKFSVGTKSSTVSSFVVTFGFDPTHWPPRAVGLIGSHHTRTIEPTSSSVFLLELTQMQGSSERKETLRQDLQTFLGLEDLPPIPNHTIPYEPVPGEIDICQTQYSHVRKILVDHGRRASTTWMEHYLLKSPRIVVSSRT